MESNHSKLSFEDDGYSYERESNINSHQSSQSKTTNSYDSNNNLPNSQARQRRRNNRVQSSIESSNQPTTNNSNYELSHSTSQDSVEIEKKKEG